MSAGPLILYADPGGCHMYMHVQRANFIECLAEGSMLVGIGSSSPPQAQLQLQPESSLQQSQSPQPADYSPSPTRPYDPIRDV